MRSLNRIMRSTGIAGIIGVVVVTAGCGGGGGGSAPSTSGFALPNDLTKLKPGVVSTISPTLAAWTPGDEWYYAISGAVRQDTSVVKSIHSSYLGLTIGTPTGGDPGTTALTDQRYLVFDDNSVESSVLKTFLTGGGGASYFEVGDTAETDGNVEEAGNGLCDLQSFEVFPATFGLSTGFTGSAAMFVPTGAADKSVTACAAGGATITNQEQVSFTVLDQENVTVGAGTFETWKVRSTRVYVNQGIQSVDTAWWAPQIGGFVRMDSERQIGQEHESFSYKLVGFKNQATATQLPLVKM